MVPSEKCSNMGGLLLCNRPLSWGAVCKLVAVTAARSRGAAGPLHCLDEPLLNEVHIRLGCRAGSSARVPLLLQGMLRG